MSEDPLEIAFRETQHSQTTEWVEEFSSISPEQAEAETQANTENWPEAFLSQQSSAIRQKTKAEVRAGLIVPGVNHNQFYPSPFGTVPQYSSALPSDIDRLEATKSRLLSRDEGHCANPGTNAVFNVANVLLNQSNSALNALVNAVLPASSPSSLPFATNQNAQRHTAAARKNPHRPTESELLRAKAAESEFLRPKL